jgi:hypothetical protein
MINMGLVEEGAFPGDVLWGTKWSSAWACECFGGVHRAKPLGIRPCEGVVNCEL